MSIANCSTHTHTHTYEKKNNGRIYVSRANIADFVKGYLRQQSLNQSFDLHQLSHHICLILSM